jgi:molecular chaperone GrpE
MSNSSETTNESDLQSQLEAARAEASEYKDKYLRLAADIENTRKLLDRRATDRVKNEKKAIFVRLIEVVDDLERALSYQDVANRETLLDTVRMMHTQLTNLLEREGVTSFASAGSTFDPRIHDAVESVDNSGHPEGHVVQETQRGYRLGDELLRPARVHVSSGNDASKDNA